MTCVIRFFYVYLQSKRESTTSRQTEDITLLCVSCGVL